MFVRDMTISVSTIIIFIVAMSSCLAESAASGGEFVFSNNDAPDRAQYRKIIQQLNQSSASSISSAAADSIVAAENGSRQSSASSVKFEWPLQAVPWSKDFSYYGYSNFVDHDAANPGSLLDYQCGNRTYDVDGYNHRGTDIFLWPFPWNKMADDEVEVIAAAAGTIVLKTDGNDDDSCGYTGKEWNAVLIEHADSSIAWYSHFKKGSLTKKEVGDSVVTGEFLGIVGSSGNSSIPHLHFEIYDVQGNLIDPFSGECNSLNAESRWIEQPDYFESSINRLTVGVEAPNMGRCPAPAAPNEKDTLVADQKTVFTAYFAGQRNTDETNYEIRSPDGSVIESWQHSSPEPRYNASYWFWEFAELATRGGYGVWEFSANYLSTHHVKRFNVIPDCENSVDVVGDVLLDLQKFCSQSIPEFSLPSNQWRQIALPADAGAVNTVLDLFGDDLPPRTYGLDWVLFSYDANDQSYRQLGIMDELKLGSGYWMIQQTGETVSLSLIDHIPQDLAGIEVPFNIEEAVSWQMLGYSGASAGKLGDIFNIFNTNTCLKSAGCSLTDASDQGLIYPVAFHYDGNEYQSLDALSLLTPWTAVWIAVLPNTGQSTALILSN